MGNIGRKRRVLIEKLLPNKIHKRETTGEFIPLVTPINQNANIFIKNSFVVELEMTNGLIVDEYRVQGFKIENIEGKKTLKIKTILHIKEWVEDYSKVVIAKISINDVIGNEVNSFDFDVSFLGYSVECDYKGDGFMTPYFLYEILED